MFGGVISTFSYLQMFQYFFSKEILGAPLPFCYYLFPFDSVAASF
jgi:hypothetical protein